MLSSIKKNKFLQYLSTFAQQIHQNLYLQRLEQLRATDWGLLTLYYARGPWSKHAAALAQGGIWRNAPAHTANSPQQKDRQFRSLPIMLGVSSRFQRIEPHCIQLGYATAVGILLCTGNVKTISTITVYVTSWGFHTNAFDSISFDLKREVQSSLIALMFVKSLQFRVKNPNF